MIVQEKEPLSPQRGFKVTAKWSSQKPSKQEKIVVGHSLTTIFLCMQSIDLTAYPWNLVIIDRSNSAMQVLSQPCSQTAKTLMKVRRTEHLHHFLIRPQKWDNYWLACKMSLRRGYNITEIVLWYDYIDMFIRLGRGTYNAHYICPDSS